MGQIQVEKNAGGIEGLCVITPTVHGDDRGYFMETYNLNDMKEAGLDLDFVQDNQSSSGKGVLRGLHYQKNFPQGKLVRVIRGSVFDVAVDLRKAVKPMANGMDLNYQRKTKNSFIFQRDLPMVISFLVNGLNFVINAPTSIIRGMMAGLFGMIPKSVLLGRMSQENIRAMALLPVTA